MNFEVNFEVKCEVSFEVNFEVNFDWIPLGRIVHPEQLEIVVGALCVLQELVQQDARLFLILKSLELYSCVLIEVLLHELLLDVQDGQEVQLELAEIAEAELVEEQRVGGGDLRHTYIKD